MYIYAKQKLQLDSILQSLGQYNQMTNSINLIDNSNSNDSYSNNNTKNTSINNENNALIQETIIKTEIRDEIEDISTFDENNLISTADTMVNIGENILNDIANNSIINEITIKTELFEEHINESLEKESYNQETDLIDKEDISMNHDNESALSQGNSIENNLNIQSFNNSSTPTENVDSNDKRSFKCDLCLKAFTNFTNLKIHLRIHTGDKPFKCPYCPKTCTRSGNLKIHLRIHTGDKPFKCSKCPKAFTTSSHLKDHHRTHTGKTILEHIHLRTKS